VPPSRLLLLAAALLCVAPVLPTRAPAAAPGVGPDVTATTAALDRTPVAAVLEDDVVPETPVVPDMPVAPVAGELERAPSAVPDEVVTMRVAIRVDEAPDDAVDQVVGLDGVAHATAVLVGRLAVGAGDHLDVAAVDPDGFRPFTPEVVADEPGVWARLDEGAVAVTHEHAERLGLVLGDDVALGGVPVRVGAFASNGLPPVADAVVDVATAPTLGLDAVAPTLLVGVTEDTDPVAVAAAIDGLLGTDATVVPDPRAPRTVAPAPPQGDTVWDVLAACESSGDWHVNTGNGFYGGLQFLPESWWLVGGEGMPHEASREEQIARAERLLALQGWEAWPVCSIRVGLRPDPAAG
jgi:hypothetical protein